ncbi:hypothetical protein HN800_00195 [bacterium]|jgi:hypothetical protein|nr:hypothetical protein [bacterium]MBT4335187.1 hypothetical protein [bacterium]MBT4495973.1 hypothetical protein [bacterium]MBT4763509.1 hypothetical protein [bacterium]MBT5400880.1 hypothetical protein [bacterium]
MKTKLIFSILISLVMLIIFTSGVESKDVDLGNRLNTQGYSIVGLPSADGTTADEVVNYNVLENSVKGGLGIWQGSMVGDIQNFNTGNIGIQTMLMMGSASLEVETGENLIYGNIDAASQGNLMLLQNNSSSKFIIDAAGNVGIGKVPEYILDVSSNGGQSIVKIGDDLVVDGYGVFNGIMDFNGLTARFDNNTSFSDNVIIGYSNPAGGNTKLTIRQVVLDTASIELLTDVSGISSGNTVHVINFNSRDPDSGGIGAVIKTVAPTYHSSSNNKNPLNIVFQTTETGNTTLEDRLIITHDGKVGIGDSNPSVALAVNGGVKIGAEATCDATNAGTLSYSNQILNLCIGTGWIPIQLGAVVEGCTISGAENYNPNANVDDGSCIPNSDSSTLGDAFFTCDAGWVSQGNSVYRCATDSFWADSTGSAWSGLRSVLHDTSMPEIAQMYSASGCSNLVQGSYQAGTRVWHDGSYNWDNDYSGSYLERVDCTFPEFP